MSLKLHELIHFSLSSAVALLVIVLFSPTIPWWLVWLSAMASGFFLDLDHLFDHCFAFGIRGFLQKGWASFFTGDPFHHSGKVFVLAHAWEFSLLLWLGVVAIPSSRLTPLAIALALSYTTHLLFDQLTWPKSKWSYFLAYRFLTGFKLDAF